MTTALPLFDALDGTATEAELEAAAQELVRDAHAANVTWYAVNEPAGMVLAAARAWHWFASRRWVSKREAWEWAKRQADARLGAAPA